MLNYRYSIFIQEAREEKNGEEIPRIPYNTNNYSKIACYFFTCSRSNKINMIETCEPIVIFARNIENLIDLNININKILFKFSL